MNSAVGPQKGKYGVVVARWKMLFILLIQYSVCIVLEFYNGLLHISMMM